MISENRFIIFGFEECEFTVMAIDFCSASHLEYLFLDIGFSESVLGDYKEYYNHPTVPIILANNITTGSTTKVGGYTELLDFLK